jgi:hypothetical protein
MSLCQPWQEGESMTLLFSEVDSFWIASGWVIGSVIFQLNFQVVSVKGSL